MNTQPCSPERLDQIMDDLYPKLRSLLVEIGSYASLRFSTDAEQARLQLCLQHPTDITIATDHCLKQAFDQITRDAAEAATLAVLTIALGSKLD